jgi:hypothetical protein
MVKYLGIFIISLLFCQTILSQEVNAAHDIQPGNGTNEYTIKTTIKGLEGVDIARIKYFINNDHTYKASPNNALFSDRNENYVKFYVMAVPTTGIINVEFGVVLGGGEEYAFPVEFQYSRNEEKQLVNFPEIVLSGAEVIASRNSRTYTTRSRRRACSRNSRTYTTRSRRRACSRNSRTYTACSRRGA